MWIPRTLFEESTSEGNLFFKLFSDKTMMIIGDLNELFSSHDKIANHQRKYTR